MPVPAPTATNTPTTATPAPTATTAPQPRIAAYILSDTAATLRSEDAGATWQEVLPFPASLSFVGGEEGWAASSHELLKTTDGGRTWSTETDQLPSTDVFFGPIDFADSQDGILAAAIPDDPNADLGAKFTVSLVQTNDGGGSWTLAFERERCEVADLRLCPFDRPGCIPASLCFTDAGHALAVACGQVLRSDDGGGTWVAVTSFPADSSARAPRVSCGGGGALWVIEADSVSRSIDGGLNWEEQPVPPGTTDVSFVSDQTGWAVTSEGLSTAVYRTMDGGEHWEQQFTPPAFGPEQEFTPPPAVHFEDARHGVMAEFHLTGFSAFPGWVGFPRRWLTDDGGTSWAEVELGRRGTATPPRPSAFLGAIGLGY